MSFNSPPITASDQNWGTKAYQTTNAGEFSAGDFNGDGKTEFFYRRDNSQDVHVLPANGVFPTY